MSCRAPFQPDEQYEQLRRPNPGQGAAPQLPAGMPLEQQAHLFNEYAAVGFAPAPYATGPVSYGAPAQAQMMGDMASGSSVAYSKLSVNANIFVPNKTGNGNMGNSNMSNSNMGKRHGPGPHQQQYAHPHPHHMAQHQQQQRYMNGYKQQNQHAHHHQQNYNHHQQQQQQNQQFNNDMMQLTNSVQSRLKIGNQTPHNGGNFYQQQQVQTLQHQQHTQQQQSKFQRHAHLNNSFQQIAQQPPQQQYFQQQQQQQHQQQQQQQPQPSTSAAAASNSSASSHPDMETIALEYLDTVIHCLNQNPGQFDTIASRFLTIFDGMESNNYVLSIAMEDIFEKSIEQPNFRYMGAKLYNLLHMLNLKPDSLFHTLLKCKLDYHQAEVAKYSQSVEQQQKVRETALFLAELYMQLRGDDDARMQLIAVNIVFSLIQLLSLESAENVRCICQTLKLAGYDLSADCQPEMQFIITSLQQIEAKAPGKYPMAANVIALQQNNWGRKVLNALGGDDDAAAPPEPPRLSDEPVFYGPDGRELTAEETDFLTAEDDANNSDGDDFDVRDNDLDLDPEMDEETERAYKDFCKQGKQQAQANKKS